MTTHTHTHTHTRARAHTARASIQWLACHAVFDVHAHVMLSDMTVINRRLWHIHPHGAGTRLQWVVISDTHTHVPAPNSYTNFLLYRCVIRTYKLSWARAWV